MKKLFFLTLLIVSFGFLFNSEVPVYAKGCDDFAGLKCGGWAKCDETSAQSGCLAECTVAKGYGDWAYPYCDCKLNPEVSECKCKCEEGDPVDLTDGCVGNFCKTSGLGIGGKCLSETTYQCCTATEVSCSDGIDNDCDGLIDCADTDADNCPDGTSCGDNKECKAGSCEAKVLPIPTCSFTNCEDKNSADCLCGTTKISGGMYCCKSLNKGYTIQTDCQDKCKPSCLGNCQNEPQDCFCDSKLMTKDKFCYNGNVYNSYDDCDKVKKAPPVVPKIVCPSKAKECEGVCIQNPLCAETFEQLINAIINFLFYLGIALAPLMVVIAAFYLTTAGGDPKKIETAKNILFYTFIGLLIILLAKALIAMIKGVL